MPARTTGHNRLPRWIAAVRRRRTGLPLLLVALLALGACGLKTPPRPLSEVLPAPDGLRAWQREGAVIVSWQVPNAAALADFGGLRGFELWVQPRPLLCLDCVLPEPTRHRLPLDGAGLQVQGAQAYYALPLPADAGQLNLRVSTRFGLGLGPASAPVMVERAAEIPAPQLAWRWVGRGPDAGARSVQFYWPAVRERIVQMIGTDGLPREQVQDYRANLYRRVPPAPWPMQPLNGAPLPATHWIVPPLQAEFPAGATAEAYTLRFVDHFGNEGAASPEVLIPLTGRRP
ncbi:MAG TPA: hypothetical protein VKB51_10565 [bacterium]|nr:hypothetical protein [bacterium]